MPNSIYLGLDVAKASVTLASEPAGLSGEFATDTAGLTALVQAVPSQSVTLVVVEATGGYEAPVVAALVTAGLPVAVVNPRQVRDAKSATSPKRSGASARPTGSTPRGSRSSGRGCSRPRARCQMRPRRSSKRCSPGGGSCSRCSRPSGSAARGPAGGWSAAASTPPSAGSNAK
jgi:hypothetical protein